MMSPALPVVSGQQTIRALEHIGFVVIGQRGSHVKLRHTRGNTVIVPRHHELAKGTLRSIIRQSGLDVEEFLKLLTL